ncbi:High mobility group box domain [Pseudocohnilembus persalinus]|uniref:High mobility group box domain n=1 Tax=Pseudocohnilembus persalinus TaxID=266149 RepID=A0A0V0R793_PSEPJ|nr:High mobility group box domain [Pseudocohnilembus persalinus]|eukprot:KRX10381.1 High mobility group box domain [Pseudocohnilembus persalinus]
MIQIRKLAVQEWNELEQEEKDLYQQIEYKQKQEYEKQIIQYKIQFQNPGAEIEQEIEKIVNNIIIKEKQNKQKREQNEFDQQDKEAENQQQFQNYNINVNIGGNLNDMEIELINI